MQILALQIAIGEGKDKQVDKLFDGAFGRLIQITLRAQAVLDSHQSAMPIAIQCVAGQGTLTVADVAEPVVLVPGVVVMVEANVSHAVMATPEVSILVTFFRQNSL